jgi:hypothetical protein
MTLCMNDCTFQQIQNALQCIKIICKNLPCPLCSNEATLILKRYNLNNIKTKEDFKKFIFMFHNLVNVKLKAASIEYETIEQIHNQSLNTILNEFFKVYSNIKTTSNMMLYTFHRNIIISNTRKYFLENKELYRFN